MVDQNHNGYKVVNELFEMELFFDIETVLTLNWYV